MNKLTTAIRLMLLTAPISLLGAAGCVGDATQAPEEGTVTPASDDVVHRTLVHIDAAGKESVSYETVPRAQVIAEMQARQQQQTQTAAAQADGLGVAQQAISQDTGCAGASLWLYSVTSDPSKTQWVYESPPLYGGFDDMICFSSSASSGGAGSINLSQYSQYYNYFGKGTWAGAVRAYWPGCSAGYFWNANTGIGEGFPANGPFTVATNDSTIEGAAYVALYTACP